MRIFYNTVVSTAVGMLAAIGLILATDAPEWGTAAVAIIVAVQMATSLNGGK